MLLDYLRFTFKHGLGSLSGRLIKKKVTKSAVLTEARHILRHQLADASVLL